MLKSYSKNGTSVVSTHTNTELMLININIYDAPKYFVGFGKKWKKARSKLTGGYISFACSWKVKNQTHLRHYGKVFIFKFVHPPVLYISNNKMNQYFEKY